MSDKIIAITDSQFQEEVIKSQQPVLVDCWAPWCGPCVALAPIIESVVINYPNVRFVKVNIDENPETPSTYNVLGIPTILLFKNGEVVARKTGLLTHSELVAFLDRNLT